jgi:hypothetical protein
VLGQSKALFDLPPQAIARDGIARSLHCHRKTESGMRESIGLHAQSEEAIVDASPAGVDRIELQLAAQSQLSAKTIPTGSGLHLRPALMTSSIV